MNQTPGRGEAHRGSTPLRGTKAPQTDGVCVLRKGDTGGEGFEDRLIQILKAVPDVSLRSDALAADATTWRERLHLDPSRANLLRAFSIQPNSHILEVGAGCGAVTRFLGESGALVDAIEASLPQARVARERCRDLPRVAVFAGKISDIPMHPEYDMVVVTDLAGLASTHPDGYAGFLQECADRLSASGSLIVATSNRVGVRFLVGAQEPIRASVSNGSGDPLPNLSRVELESVLDRVGLIPRTLAVFPDHHFARMVASPSSLPDDLRHLLYRIPEFPSPDPAGARPRNNDEGAAWESLVEAGLASDTANSLVVLAGKGQRSDLWPRDRAVSYFSVGRRPLWSTTTHVRISRSKARFTCERLYPDCDEPPIHLQGYDEPAHLGTDLVTFCVDADDEAIGKVLGDWVSLLNTRESEGGEIPLDLVPHNAVLQPDGVLAVFDEEWWADAGSFLDYEHVRGRGVLWLAVRVCRYTPRRPRSQATVRDLAVHYGAKVGLEGSWLDETLNAEARFQALVHPRPLALDEEEWRKRFVAMLTAALDAPASSESEAGLGSGDLAQLRRNLGSLEPRLLGPGLSAGNEDLALLLGFRIYSRAARFFLPAGTRRNRLSNRIARRLLRLK